MKTPLTQRVVRASLRKYLSASVENSWKGGGDPADIPEIVAELEEAENQFNTVLFILWDVYEKYQASILDKTPAKTEHSGTKQGEWVTSPPADYGVPTGYVPSREDKIRNPRG